MTLAEVLLLKQPWLIQPAAFQAMAAASRLFPNGCSELTAGPNSPLLCVEDGIGIVALNGPMMQRPDVFSQILFGATDTEELLRRWRRLLSGPISKPFFWILIPLVEQLLERLSWRRQWRTLARKSQSTHSAPG